MKPWKQSNSMKELLKKLRRHDTLVLGAGVVAATIMCGAFVYVTTPAISADAAQAEVRKDSLGVQKKASDQLTEINNYLERLDQVVSGSQELVKEIQTIQNEQKVINEKTLEKNNNKETKTNTNTESTKVVEKISGLEKEFESLHTDIQATTDQIKELKDRMDKGDSSDTDKDKENFAQINNALMDIRKECENSGAAVTSLIAELKSNSSKESSENTTIVNNLEKIERDIQRTDTTETLTRMESELMNTQSTYVALLESFEHSMEKSFSNVDKDINNVEKSISNVNKDINSVEKSITTVGENMNGMDKRIEAGIASVDNNVSGVGQKVDSGIADVGNNVDEVGRKVDTGLSAVGSNVNEVGEKVDSGLSAVGNSVNEVGEKVDAGLSNVDNNVDKVGEKVTSGLSSVDSSIGEVGEKVESGISGIDQKVGAGFSNMDQSVNAVNQSVSSGLSGVTSSVNSVHEAQVSTDQKVTDIGTKLGGVESKVNKIDTEIGSLRKRIEDFFNYLTSVKKEMASTLVKLGVNIRTDASFEEIINGIKQVPAAVINSGNVDYVIHHHKNGSGAYPHETSPSKGGCFQVAVYHTHSNSCYTTLNLYKYNVMLFEVDTKAEEMGMGRFWCDYCQKYYLNMVHQEDATDINIARERAMNGSEIQTYSSQKLICGKTTTSIDGYSANCGYKEGGIEKATITYPKNITAVNAMSVSAINSVPEMTFITREVAVNENYTITEISEGEGDETEAQDAEVVSEVETQDAVEVSEDTQSEEGIQDEEDVLQDEQEAQEEQASEPVTESGREAENSSEQSAENRDDQNGMDTGMPDDSDGEFAENSDEENVNADSESQDSQNGLDLDLTVSE